VVVPEMGCDETWKGTHVVLAMFGSAKPRGIWLAAEGSGIACNKIMVISYVVLTD
jgi:hypothetical protein